MVDTVKAEDPCTCGEAAWPHHHHCVLEGCGKRAMVGIGPAPVRWYCQPHLEGVFREMRNMLDELEKLP